MINISVSVSKSVIFIADISVIGISVHLLIGAPLTIICSQYIVYTRVHMSCALIWITLMLLLLLVNIKNC